MKDEEGTTATGGRENALSDGVELLELEVLVGRVDDLDVKSLTAKGQGGGRSGRVDGDSSVLEERERTSA
jgi:hypothetical protein